MERKHFAGWARGAAFRAATALALAGAGMAAANAQTHTKKHAAAAKPTAPTAAHAAVQNLAAVQGVTFVKWTEPKEGAFSLDVPKGWKVEGVLSRVALTDVRTAVQVRSPEDNMTVLLGDPGLPMFNVPTPLDQQMGRGEGFADVYEGLFQRVILHYMPAPEFNRWYLQNRMNQVIDNLNVEEEKPLTELGEKMTASANQNGAAGGNGAHIKVTVAITTFSGQVKATGKPISGAILSTIRLFYGDTPGYISSWTAEPAVMGCENGANKDALVKTTLGVFLRMKQTLAPTPAWSVKEMRRITGIRDARNKQLLAAQRAGGARPSTGGRTSGGGGGAVSQNSLMASYWRRNAQRAESTHQFINYIRDEKDIFTSNGERVTVSDK